MSAAIYKQLCKFFYSFVLISRAKQTHTYTYGSLFPYIYIFAGYIQIHPSALTGEKEREREKINGIGYEKSKYFSDARINFIVSKLKSNHFVHGIYRMICTSPTILPHASK